MTDSPRTTILPAAGERVSSTAIRRSVPPPLPPSGFPRHNDEDLPHEDPIAYLGTAQHPLSVPPTALDIEPSTRAPSTYSTAPHKVSRIGEHLAMTGLAALLVAPIFLGLSGHRGSTDPVSHESAVAGIADVSANVTPARNAPAEVIADAAEAPNEGSAEAAGEAAVIQIPALEITSRWAEVKALRRAAHENRGKPATAPVTAATTLTPFDFSGAMNAVIAARVGPSQCGAQAIGAAPVVITFAPSGRATRAVVEGGPFRGTDTGSCIATELREVRIAPFEGDLATLRTTVFLR